MCFFFFSSRRRHTRYIGDWSSDVCSSDLAGSCWRTPRSGWTSCGWPSRAAARSEERRVGKGVDLGGRRIIKKKNEHNNNQEVGVSRMESKALQRKSDSQDE